MLCEERANVILPNSDALVREQQMARRIAPQIAGRKERRIDDHLCRGVLLPQGRSEGRDRCSGPVILGDHEQRGRVHPARSIQHGFPQRGTKVPYEGAAGLIYDGAERAAAARGKHRNDAAK
jgi:hypothetical protein